MIFPTMLLVEAWVEASEEGARFGLDLLVEVFIVVVALEDLEHGGEVGGESLADRRRVT